MLKIWGRLSSINVQKVVWCARDLGCEYERIEAGGAFGVVDTPAFQRLNPNRKVPVIEDDGFVLWESNAIVRYLCARHPESGLMPDSLTARADCDRWMDWQATEFTPVMRDAFMQLVRTPPGGRDEALLEASIRQTEPMLAILDDALAARSFIAGDKFTMADIPVACAAHRWTNLPIERIQRPNVDKWLQRASNRAGALEVLTLPIT
jgi:glutathione S-transferase